MEEDLKFRKSAMYDDNMAEKKKKKDISRYKSWEKVFVNDEIFVLIGDSWQPAVVRRKVFDVACAAQPWCDVILSDSGAGSVVEIYELRRLRRRQNENP